VHLPRVLWLFECVCERERERKKNNAAHMDYARVRSLLRLLCVFHVGFLHYHQHKFRLPGYQNPENAQHTGCLGHHLGDLPCQQLVMVVLRTDDSGPGGLSQQYHTGMRVWGDLDFDVRLPREVNTLDCNEGLVYKFTEN